MSEESKTPDTADNGLLAGREADAGAEPSPTTDLLGRLLDGAADPPDCLEEPASDRVDRSAEPSLWASLSERDLQVVVDHLILDSLLAEQMGAESLAAVVDTAGEPAPATAAADERRPEDPRPVNALPAPKVLRWRTWRAIQAAAALGLIIGAYFIGQQSVALASASTVLQAALEAHAEPIERQYLVTSERSLLAEGSWTPPDEIRVATQGDRYYVQMRRGERRWHWGREASGSLWIALGPRRAMVIEPDEMGPPLAYIADLYSLHLETVLETFLRHCDLTYVGEYGPTHVIRATPRVRTRSWLQQATIVVDRETKAVRRLTLERQVPNQGRVKQTFALVAAGSPDESKYRPEGHLTAPYRLLNRATKPDRRREILIEWFGAAATRWLKETEQTP